MKRSLISLAIATRPFSSTSQIAWNNTAPRTAVAAASASANTYKPSSTTTKPRTAYARVAKPATNASSFRKTIPTKALAPAPSQPSEPSLIDVNVSDDAYTDGFAAEPFPDPQPASEIPDYARLAPPVDFSGSDSSSSSPTAMDTRLYESPAPQEARAPVGEDWTTSFYGLSAKPFAREVADVLLRPLAPADIEIKPDGLLYLPEIKYRRTLNEAFGPGGWGLAPRGETTVGPRIVSREWGLVCLGRLVGIARGEQEYFDPSGVPTATEACKSNALMRCCKDLGIASELWDPSFIKKFKTKHCTEAFVEHVVQKKKRKLWRKNDAKFDYPYKEV